MPLNEAAGRRRTSLTKEQQRTQDEALYGLAPKEQMDNILDNITHEEIERMRRLIIEHDKASGTIGEFDLNKPPQERYVYQPFPKTIYHHAKALNRIVRSQDELQGFLELGWSRTPPVEVEQDAEPVRLDASAQAEIERVDAALRTKKKS